MLIELPKLDTAHPTIIWDYLVDMPYMPSKRDREHIEKLADKRDQPQRTRIWDYFFRPEEKDVGKPVQAELSELQAVAAAREVQGRQLLQESSDAFARFEQGWQNEHDAVEARLHEIRANTASREKRGGWKSVITGILLTEGSVYGAIRLYIALENAQIPGEPAAGCLLWLLFLLTFPAFFAGVIFFFTGRRRLVPDRVRALIASRQKNVQDAWSQRGATLQSAMKAESQRVTYAKEMIELLVPHIQSRIAHLERLLADLRAQIRTPPTADEVQEWFLADQEKLKDYGEEQLAMTGDLVKVRKVGEKPLLITGPAEIQATDLIPPTYRGTDPDRTKYLCARRFEETADGRMIPHYGVSYLEFLYIGQKMLGRFSVFFDFIRGERIRESAPQHHYADVVLLEMRHEYRKILIIDKTGPVEVELETEPSMILTLKGGAPVTITVPSNEYFERVQKDSPRANDDATAAAQYALKAIAAKVKAAKQKLERSPER
jgi:hypothetical protein